MGVVCGTNRKARKVLSAKGSTDSSGKFEIDLPSHLHAIPNIEKVCHVRIVKIPESSPCRQACSAKHNKPITLTSINQGIRTYTTQNIHLTKWKTQTNHHLYCTWRFSHYQCNTIAYMNTRERERERDNLLCSCDICKLLIYEYDMMYS